MNLYDAYLVQYVTPSEENCHVEKKYLVYVINLFTFVA